MIFESAPWKDQLLRDASVLRRLAKEKLDLDDCERELVRLERVAFVTAFTMRKLWESNKLSTSWNDKKLVGKRFELIGKAPDLMNNHRVEKFYDLRTPKDVNLKPLEYCSRIIHGFIFSPLFNKQNYIEGFFFTSDNMKAQCVWLVKLRDVVELIRRTGRDYPSSGAWIRTTDGQLKMWAGDNDPPVGWLESAKRGQKK